MARFPKQLIVVVLSFLTVSCTTNKQVSFQSGDMTHTFQEGQGFQAKNFPLPLYPGSTTTGAVSAEGDKNNEQAKFLMLSSTDSIEKVTKYYKNELEDKGWKVANIQTLPNLVSIQASKSDLEANVMIAQDNQKTTVSLGISKEADNGPIPNPSTYVPNKFTPPTD